ncbi:DUF86 domain-containing protein [Patescibacteria group bacterium]|nr:DUF86 domain-containing protein [Patescibacteria group bacterium]MBU1931148.1 DUF86 domain-containing protein [Patescibacteria group bacterium]
MNKKDRISQIHEKLVVLGGYVELLRGFGKVTAGDLIKDDIKRGAIERFMQLSAEVVLDVAGQLIAEYRFRTPEDYKDSLLILGEEGVLTKKFAGEFSSIAGFRNILVHDYLKIDYEKVVDKLNNQLGDFAKFAQSVAKYLQ